MSNPAVAVHPSSSGNPVVSIIERGLAEAGAAVRAFPNHVPEGGVVLLHWSESLWLRSGIGLRALTRHFDSHDGRGVDGFVAALRAARHGGSIVLWVRHNRLPHGWSGTIADWDRRSEPLWRQVDGVIHLHQESLALDRGRPWSGLPSTIIAHPRYDESKSSPRSVVEAVPIREILIPGAIEGRKQHWPSIMAIRGVGLAVTVVGKPATRRVVRRLHRAAGRSAGSLTVIDEYVSQEELDALHVRARAIVLNQPDQLNSGALWFALSRGALVLGVDSPAMRAGQSVAGPTWVRILSTMSVDAIRLGLLDGVPSGRPDLSALPTGRRFAEQVLSFARRVALERARA